jgi:thiamine-phosphate pyrophosphorylase
MFIGISAGDAGTALAAQNGGADYLGSGPVFATGSKADARAVIGVDGLRKIIEAARVPAVGIGGISADSAEEVTRAGAAGAAVISAILSQPDIKAAAEAMRAAADSGRRLFLRERAGFTE